VAGELLWQEEQELQIPFSYVRITRDHIDTRVLLIIMRIGYPCINRSIGCKGDRTFRLLSYSDERLRSTIATNLACLKQILEWNADHGLLFFRISSDLVPFASHPICTLFWQDLFRGEFSEIGFIIRREGIRISMHPDQFIVLNARDPAVVRRSIAELSYHAEVLDLMGLDFSAKIQLHIGGLYGDKERSMKRFVEQYRKLDQDICRRLVIEHDEKRYSAADCLEIHQITGVPVVFDLFHHTCFNQGETVREIISTVGETWSEDDGAPMVDYSSQHPFKRQGSHADHIDPVDFRKFLENSKPFDFDLMLEIKDKEESALIAAGIARYDPRFIS
jgi:UV DNA damage endonuclease